MYEAVLTIGTIIFTLGFIWAGYKSIIGIGENWDPSKTPEKQYSLPNTLAYIFATIIFALMMYGFSLKLPLP